MNLIRGKSEDFVYLEQEGEATYINKIANQEKVISGQCMYDTWIDGQDLTIENCTFRADTLIIMGESLLFRNCNFNGSITHLLSDTSRFIECRFSQSLRLEGNFFTISTDGPYTFSRCKVKNLFINFDGNTYLRGDYWDIRSPGNDFFGLKILSEAYLQCVCSESAYKFSAYAIIEQLASYRQRNPDSFQFYYKDLRYKDIVECNVEPNYLLDNEIAESKFPLKGIMVFVDDRIGKEFSLIPRMDEDIGFYASFISRHVVTNGEFLKLCNLSKSKMIEKFGREYELENLARTKKYLNNNLMPYLDIDNFPHLLDGIDSESFSIVNGYYKLFFLLKLFSYYIPTAVKLTYCAKALSASEFYWGSDLEDADKYEVFCASDLSEVGTKKPNRFGLYDVIGNAPELTMDYAGFAASGNVPYQDIQIFGHWHNQPHYYASNYEILSISQANALNGMRGVSFRVMYQF